MRETLVKPETADLAHRMGFELEEPKDEKKLRSSIEEDVPPVQIPTQSILQRWLRNKFNIHISISYNKYWRYHIYILKKGFTVEGYSLNATYEGALEKGLQMALRLIKI